MKRLTIQELADSAAMSVDDVRATLVHGWTARLLALAGGVSGAYFRKELAARRVPGTKVGTTWIIPREFGDAWLQKRDIAFEE
ncbi:MAG: hypothetical protein JXR84_15135 [Anaerolineae bacterium]|nr:hypothetical protein [Anaerolineae bacterium]